MRILLSLYFKHNSLGLNSAVNSDLGLNSAINSDSNENASKVKDIKSVEEILFNQFQASL